MPIQKLSKDIVNKIAAGEVVERPASVVKELVENSLDAGATHIEVELRAGGRDYIRIQDNGSGMNRDDAILSVEQHATSKISSVDDLLSLYSFGFRGEALASISSVSDFVLHTRETDAIEGVEVKVKDSESIVNAVSCKNGTKIEVMNLFKNIPARREYLKRDTTEYRYVLDTFTQFALAHANVSFTLIHNDKTIYHLKATENPIERIEQLFKKDIASIMMPIDFSEGNFSVEGFIGKPHKFVKNKSYQFLFINGRYVKSPAVHKAVLQGYGSLLPHGTQPVYVLNIKMDPKIVDVNVHPRKLEVRFANSQEVFRFFVRAINKVLRTEDLNKNIDDHVDQKVSGFGSEPFSNQHFSSRNSERSSMSRGNNYSQGSLGYSQKSFSGGGNYSQGSFRSQRQENMQSPSLQFDSVTQKSSDNFVNDMQDVMSGQVENIKQSSLAQQYDIGDWKLLGQVKNSYLLVEAAGRGLLIIDQHGAAERVNYHRLLAEFEAGGSSKKQQLLLPLTIDVTIQELELLLEHRDDFAKFGFDIEQFGEKTISVNSVPTIIKHRDPKKIVDEILADVLENSSEKGAAESFTIDYMLKTIACKSAIKFGDRLTLEEQMKLVHDTRYHIGNEMACAHGRPIILELSWNYIDKRFERT